MKKWMTLIGVILIIALDQFSKYYALEILPGRQAIHILPGLNFYITYNHGVAFSLFYNLGLNTPWILVIFTSVLSLILLILMLKTKLSEMQKLIALTLMLGGALSNLFDRVYYGAVIDFIDVYIGYHHWPVFNLADCSICVGAFLLLLIKEPQKSNS